MTAGPANPYRGEASLPFADKVRTLRPSFSALVAAEEELGPLFALVESFAVAFALGVAWRAGDRSERITLDRASLEVRFLPGRRRMRFQSYWVRVRLAPGNRHHRLLLRSHGRELEIGAFLSDEERAELSKKLMVLLAEFSDRPRR